MSPWEIRKLLRLSSAVVMTFS